MPRGPVRRGQLIAPFGVGSTLVTRGGTSVITAGLDHWYKPEYSDSPDDQLDPNEFKFHEWRLEARLGVSHFRLPPDYRVARRGQQVPNAFLTVPFLRFPGWHSCPSCGRMEQLPLSMRGSYQCTECKEGGKTRYLTQVRFIAVCDGGHLQDFPWREWVHADSSTTCSGYLRLRATGSAALAGQKVSCGCGASRTMTGSTGADSDGSMTYLSRNLQKDGNFFCQGQRPWLGLTEGEPCARPLHTALRAASNVYFSQVRSAIYLPRGQGKRMTRLSGLLEQPPLSSLIALLMETLGEVKPEHLRTQHGHLLREYTDAELRETLALLTVRPGEDPAAEVHTDDEETAFRRSEYDALLKPRVEHELVIRMAPLVEYEEAVAGYFDQLRLVPTLRETRVLAGFTRIFAETDLSDRELRQRLWRDQPRQGRDWLPANVIFGEGLFMVLDEARLSEWEARPNVKMRVGRLLRRYEELQRERRLRDRFLGPRFLLLHTFAHLLMNRLTFESGYSSAALRERIYVSASEAAPMAGVLIYTAAGDSEGTLGGLVRMGRPGLLEPVIRRALSEASWCSADPVCMEVAEQGGQGPDSCNLAACHNCCLVPETACEEFNRFLDRGLLVGTRDDPGMAFWGDLIEAG